MSPTSDKNQFLFTQLVLIFQTAAMQHMGKLKNPMTDKVERDLPQAQAAIDMIDMVKEKTRGNLDHDEDRFISTVLQELKLNYVDEVNRPAEAPPSAETQGGETAGRQDTE